MKPEKMLGISQRPYVTMLSPEVAAQLKRYHIAWGMQHGGCVMRWDDHGPRSVDPPLIRPATPLPLERLRIFTGSRRGGCFNHHAHLVKFKNRYYYAWSNGVVHEEDAGQRVLLSSSADGHSWSQPITVVGDPEDPVTAYNVCALQASGDTLYVVSKKEDTIRDAEALAMRRVDPENTAIEVYASSDGQTWEKSFDVDERIDWIFEDPKATADGHLLCTASLKGGTEKTKENIVIASRDKPGAAVLYWPGTDLRDQPEIIPVPQPAGAVFPYAETSWYQTDDGTIVMFWRDEGQSNRVWVNYSQDGGRTFSEPMISDIPDSQSRIACGRLSDGRYYVINNALPVLLDRRHLMLMLSRDGYVFDSVRMLLNEPAAQRFVGFLKLDGYQYPCGLTDGDRLLIGYSVNKEDMELIILNTTELQ